MLIPVAQVADEFNYRTPASHTRGNLQKVMGRSVDCGCELRLQERLVKFLRRKFNNIRRALEDRWKL